MNKKIGVIGAGSWATSLAYVLENNGYEPLLFSRHKEVVDEINNNHTNSRYFNDLILPNDIKASSSIEETLKDASYIVICIPSKDIESLNDYKKYINSNPILINATKGFDFKTGLGIHYKEEEILQGVKHLGIVSLIGPTFASEVINNQYSCITAVSKNKKNNQIVQKLFSNSFFRVYTNSDLIGCEISAGMKNIIAIASGIAAGLGYENNTRAALITRGLNEIIRYGLYHKAKLKTFFSLACIGDLYLTCSSDKSRNFQAGFKIGSDNTATKFIKENNMTVEGIEACKIIYSNAKKDNLQLPITNGVYQILFENKKPCDILKSLMNRDLKEEL